MLMTVMVKSRWDGRERGKGLIVCMGREVFDKAKNIHKFGGRAGGVEGRKGEKKNSVFIR